MDRYVITRNSQSTTETSNAYVNLVNPAFPRFLGVNHILHKRSMTNGQAASSSKSPDVRLETHIRRTETRVISTPNYRWLLPGQTRLHLPGRLREGDATRLVLATQEQVPEQQSDRHQAH